MVIKGRGEMVIVCACDIHTDPKCTILIKILLNVYRTNY